MDKSLCKNWVPNSLNGSPIMRSHFEFLPGWLVKIDKRMKEAARIRRNRKLRGFKAIGMLADFKRDSGREALLKEVSKLAETDPRMATKMYGKNYIAMYMAVNAYRVRRGLPMLRGGTRQRAGKKKDYTDEQLIECIKLAMLWMTQRKYVMRPVRGPRGRMTKRVMHDRSDGEIFQDAAKATGVTSWKYARDLYKLHRGLPSNVLARIAMRQRERESALQARTPNDAGGKSPSAVLQQPAT